MREERAARSRMEAAIIRIEAMLTARLPHLATKPDLADLSSTFRIFCDGAPLLDSPEDVL